MKPAANNSSFYAAIVLYCAYLFLSNWGVSASKAGDADFSFVFSSLANVVTFTACCVMILYTIAKNLGYYTKNKFFTLAFIITLAFLTITIKNVSIILPLLLGFASVNSKDKSIAKTVVVSMSVLLVISSALSLVGLAGGDETSKSLFGGDGDMTHVVTALGLLNPNNVMLIFINVIALSLYLCQSRRQSLYVSSALLILTIALSNVTGSTTGLAVGLLTIILVNSAKHYRFVARLLRVITPWMFIIVTTLTFFVATSYGSLDSIPNSINDKLTNRPYTWNLRIEDKSYLNIYGNKDQYQTDSSSDYDGPYPFDNMPLAVLVQYGVIVYLIFFYIIYAGSKKIKDPAILAYIFIACVLMFVERMYLYSIPLLFLQKAITESHLLRKNKTKKGGAHAIN